MTTTELPPTTTAAPVLDDLRSACRRMAPLWPLDRFVAVNPYVGLAGVPFARAAEELASVAGVRSTLPARAYLELVDAGRIDRGDLEAALCSFGMLEPPADFVARVRRGDDEHAAWAARVPTVARVANQVTGRDWERLCVDRVSSWAAAHFDEGQALWSSADADVAPWRAWRDEAVIDRTPEVMGLRGFRAVIRALPESAPDAAAVLLDALGIPATGRSLYLHALLRRLPGWAGHAARIGFEREQVGECDDTLVELLVILLAWEHALLAVLGERGVEDAWADALGQLVALGDTPALREPLRDRLVLQDAFERAEERRLRAALANADPPRERRARAQVVMCIDVRSEVLRRHLEGMADDVDTVGFAGFFGMPIAHVALAHDTAEAQCPVLLTPTDTVGEVTGDAAATADAVEHRRVKHHVRRAWKSFKMGAISCFSFVGPVGLLYLPKLVTDSAGRGRPVPDPVTEGLPRGAAERGPSLDATASAAGISVERRIELAEGALRGMSLTRSLAPLVVLAGHGSSTVNNPYAAGLDCGACGGHRGDVNARVAAAILNDADVRAGLAARGIDVPADTWFVAALHDTTTDDITLFDVDAAPSTHTAAVARVRAELAAAGRLARAERAVRMGIDPADAEVAIPRRSRDWAQVRPEWGLAGCRAFVAAPRTRTRGVDLGGRAFLHSYDWREDEGFAVLELIMTAPVVVASWINLQYYGSTVDNEALGSGNKTLHNVVGKLGVLEGAAGDLRSGLPWQSVHDGTRLQHEPLRLTVVVEAPLDAIGAVLARHEHVRQLCDHGWIRLVALDDDGRIAHRYAGDGAWLPVAA